MIRSFIREDGLGAAITAMVYHLYYISYHRHLRPILPRTVAVYNGIPVWDGKLFDSIIPLSPGLVDPEYEYATVAALRGHVQSGDDVTVVGGGLGVTAVVAAKQSGPEGQVMTYEGAAEYTSRLLETLRLNRVEERVTVRHAIVAEGISLKGDPSGAETVLPSDLSDCDVLEIDCEGAELEIIEKMTIEPAVIIVETHALYDAPVEEVERLLNDRSYVVVERQLLDEEKGFHVVTALHRNAAEEKVV